MPVPTASSRPLPGSVTDVTLTRNLIPSGKLNWGMGL